MKILLISPQPFFRVRGTPINILNMLRALADAGHSVDLLCYPFGDPVEIPGVRILRSPRPPGLRDVKVGPSAAKFPLDALMAAQTAWRIPRGGYDAVHAVEESVFFAAPVARLWRIPYIYDMDSLISDQLAYSGFVKWKPLLRLVEAMERSAIRRSAGVVTVCRSLTDAARRLAPEAAVTQIEDAPLESRFRPDEAGARELRESLGLGERPCVVYTGNFESYQGLPLLIRAMETVHARRPEVALVLVGGEDRHRREMEALVEERGLEHAVGFTGRLPMERMPACLTLADVLASPRVKGSNTALKLYGYMQAGKPLVATRLETHTQVLDEDCAWLCGLDAGEMGEAILSALSDSAGAARRGAEAARRVEERYGLDRFYRQARELYEKIGDER